MDIHLPPVERTATRGGACTHTRVAPTVASNPTSAGPMNVPALHRKRLALHLSRDLSVLKKKGKEVILLYNFLSCCYIGTDGSDAPSNGSSYQKSHNLSTQCVPLGQQLGRFHLHQQTQQVNPPRFKYSPRLVPLLQNQLQVVPGLR